jgi:hypothetical protein
VDFPATTTTALQFAMICLEISPSDYPSFRAERSEVEKSFKVAYKTRFKDFSTTVEMTNGQNLIGDQPNFVVKKLRLNFRPRSPDSRLIYPFSKQLPFKTDYMNTPITFDMKTKIIILVAAFGLALSACSGKKADQENADSMYKYTDTNKVIDSTKTDSTADSTTNTPADVKN